MTSEQARKYTVIFMFVLTVVVGVAAVYIGIRLQQDQRPSDSDASGDPVCAAASDIGKYTCNASGNPLGLKRLCQSIGNVVDDGTCCSASQLFCGGNPTNPVPGACGCQPNDGVTTCSQYNNNSCQKPATTTTTTVTSGALTCPQGGPSTWCIVFRCPNGDTNGDGKCEMGDTGVTEQYSSDPNVCNTNPAGCYQVDYFKTLPAVNTNATPGNFCGARLNLNCPPPPTSTTTTAPAQVCQQVKLVNEGTYSDADGDGDTNSDGVIVKDIKVGQTVTFRGILANCDRTAANDNQRDKMRLVVFANQDQGSYDGTANVGTPIPAVVTNAEYGGGLCKYDFTWTATNVPVLATGNYKVRMAKDGLGGGNAGDGIIQSADIYWDPAGCRYKVDIIAADAPLCGDSCTTNMQCPTNHTCSATKCVLNACLNGANCDANKCNVTVVDLPDTGLLDEDGRPMLIGLLLILFGLVVNRLTGGMSLIMTNAGTWMDGVFAASPAEEAKVQRQYDDEYEQKILEKTKKQLIYCYARCCPQSNDFYPVGIDGRIGDNCFRDLE